METPSSSGSVLAETKVRDFTDLRVWKVARLLRKSVYLACTGFPKQETFVLSSQTRRAAVSVTANLAEGFGRAIPIRKTFSSAARVAAQSTNSEIT